MLSHVLTRRRRGWYSSRVRGPRCFVIGAGPAGLGLCLFLKRLAPAWELVVAERHERDAEIGFGVTMPASILEAVGYDAERWTADRSYIEWRGARHLDVALDLVTIERTRFVRWLRARCEEAGVELRFGEPVGDPRALAREGYELIVGADGAHSGTRRELGASLGGRQTIARTHHTWLATTRAFDGLATLFVPSGRELFLAFVYPYGVDRSTFIVECTTETWARRFAGRSSDEALREIGELFADHLGGSPLLTSGRELQWSQFVHVVLDRWHEGNMVVIGDAAHTANYAGGFGTLLALEDARALAESLAANERVTDGLAAFEARHRPHVFQMQQRATSRHNWHARVLADFEAGNARAVDDAIAQAEAAMRHLAP